VREWGERLAKWVAVGRWLPDWRRRRGLGGTSGATALGGWGEWSVTRCLAGQVLCLWRSVVLALPVAMRLGGGGDFRLGGAV